MPKPHKKRFLTYCVDCQGYFMNQPSEWMLKHMIEWNIDTWIIQKKCEPCLKRKDDENERIK